MNSLCEQCPKRLHVPAREIIHETLISKRRSTIRQLSRTSPWKACDCGNLSPPARPGLPAHPPSQVTLRELVDLQRSEAVQRSRTEECAGMRAPARSLGFAWSLVDVTNSETIGHEGELIYVTLLVSQLTRDVHLSCLL